LRAKVVLIQEPSEGKGGTVSHPDSRNIMKEKQVWIAVSNEAKCRRLTSQQKTGVVNVYDQTIPGNTRKPAEEINWAKLLRASA